MKYKGYKQEDNDAYWEMWTDIALFLGGILFTTAIVVTPLTDLKVYQKLGTTVVSSAGLYGCLVLGSPKGKAKIRAWRAAMAQRQLEAEEQETAQEAED